GLRDVDPKRFEAHRQQGAELLFFLERTVQATSFEGRVCHHWPLRGGDALPFVVPLAAPGTKLLSAATFKVLKERREILAACRDTVRKLAAAAASSSPPKAPKHYFLEVPPDSEAYKVLYGGSACYLYVPDVLFPRARPSLSRR
ncbi:MAG TPA: hypothetical protein VGQ83_13205, partial [Polyangia bacterium]